MPAAEFCDGCGSGGGASVGERVVGDDLFDASDAVVGEVVRRSPAEDAALDDDRRLTYPADDAAADLHESRGSVTHATDTFHD